MGRGKRPQPKIRLPEGWWLRLTDLARARWDIRSQEDIPAQTRISLRTFSAARHSNEMTEQMLARLTAALGYEDHGRLLSDLATAAHIAPRTAVLPTMLALESQKNNPQGADYRDYLLETAPPWVLTCRITTNSAYFRFGFKLLTEDGRLFGDGLINSFDENLIIHVGRNYFDRERLKIMAGDLLLPHIAAARSSTTIGFYSSRIRGWTSGWNYLWIEVTSCV